MNVRAPGHRRLGGPGRSDPPGRDPLTATAGARARHFDADGHDREVEPSAEEIAALDDRQLLWIDIDRPAADDVLQSLAPALELDDRDLDRIRKERGRAWLTRTEDHLHLSMMAVTDEGADALEDQFGEVDLLVARNVVVTIQPGDLAAIDRYTEGLTGETRLGALTAADLMSSIVDEIIGGYFVATERIERTIDDLDTLALRGVRGDHILVEIVAIRRRIAGLRRIVAPHRDALAALARPEHTDEESIGVPWPGLVARLERAVDAVDALREALIGTFDIHMGRATQRTDRVITALTVLSAVLLPASVLAGVMGMNFPLPMFEDPNNFWVTLGAMALLATSVLAVARWRRWI